MSCSRSVVVLGESGVGKTCFIDKFLHGAHFFRYGVGDAEPGSDTRQQLDVDGEACSITPMDINFTPLRLQDPQYFASMDRRQIQMADGIVLLYDITDEKSYQYITNEGLIEVWCDRAETTASGVAYPAGRQRFGCVLVGTKLDLAEKEGKRQVSQEVAEEWAAMQGWKPFEVDTQDGVQIEEAFRALEKSIRKAKRRDDEDIESELEDIPEKQARHKKAVEEEKKIKDKKSTAQEQKEGSKRESKVLSVLEKVLLCRPKPS